MPVVILLAQASDAEELECFLILGNDEVRCPDPVVAQPRANEDEVIGLSGPFGNSTQQEQLSTGTPEVAPSIEDHLL